MAARRMAFEAIGTKWDILVHGVGKDKVWSRLTREIQERIETFDASYSRFRSDSLVSQIAKRAGGYQLPADGRKMLDFYKSLYEVTEGRVTPLIGRTMENAGYDSAYSFRQSQLTKPPRWEEVLTYTAKTLTVSRPVLLDFGAAGKGYLVDLVSDVIQKAGVTDYLINAGGDILHHTSSGELLDVGLENPRDTTEAIGVVQLANLSLCASAGSKRQWGSFHHIIDPHTLASPGDILATWVIAEDTMTADGLATALFFQAPDRLEDQFKFSYALLRRDMSLQYANDFPITLFEAEHEYSR